MSALHQSDDPEDPRSIVRVRIPLVGLAVALSLVVGAIAGIVAYRYAATAAQPRTALPAPVAIAASNKLPISKPAVRQVDPQLVNGNMQVTIALDQPFPYDAHRLDHPDRVYIDLHDARLVPELAGKTQFVNKGGISTIRLAQTQPDTVRVVLDLEKRFDYSVVQQTNPPALVLKLTPRARGKRRPASSQPKEPSPQ
jgi:N-acetylmuramoyl-L-alanine amidase